MDEEIKKDQATDDRVFVDAMTDDVPADTTAPAAGVQQADVTAEQAPKADTMAPVNNASPNPMPPVNNASPNPMPQMNQQMNPMPQMNQQMNPMPQMNQQMNPMPQMNQQMNPMPQMNQQMNQMPQMNQQMNQMPQMNQQPMGMPPQQGPFSGAPQPEQPKKKKSAAPIIILVVVLLLLLCGGVAILFFTGIIGPKKEIQLSKTKVSVEAGEEVVIKIENYEDELNGIYLTYESEDPKVAKISEEYDDAFVIQGKKKGKTTVTVSGKGCETITLNVTVKD